MTARVIFRYLTSSHLLPIPMRPITPLVSLFLLWTFLSGCGSPPPEDPHVAAWKKHFQAGLAAMQEGRHDEADEQLQQALSVARQFPEGENALQSTLDRLADLCLIRGQPARAESLYLHLLDIRKTQRGPKDVGTASTLEKLADLYRSESQPARAESLYLHLLDIREPRARDGGFPAALGKLAALYRDRGEFTRADSLSKRSMALKIHAQGYHHFILGQYRQAATSYQRALALQERNLHRNHPDLAMTCFDLGRLLNLQDSPRQAGIFYRRALAIHEANPDPGHLDQTELLTLLTALLKRAEKPEERDLLKARIDSVSPHPAPP